MLARHCIVIPSPAASESDRWGQGIVIHCLELARWLHDQGHSVTVLHSHRLPDIPSSPIQPHSLGVELCQLPEDTAEIVKLPRCADLDESLRVASFLLGREFDFIHFQDWKGLGFAPLQRRRTLGLPGQPVITTTLHGGTEREMELTGTFPPGTVEKLISAFGERYSVQHADAVILPSPELEPWAARLGWSLPATRVTVPWLTSNHNRIEPPKLGQEWDQWLAAQSAARATVLARPSPPADSCRLTVCLAHFNHGPYLAEALASLAVQTFPGFTVVIVDDGSSEAASRVEFTRLEQLYADRDWRFVRTENRGAASTRNHAVTFVQSEFIVFMDTDNVARPEMLETFITAADRSGADALSCHFHVFEGEFDSAAPRCPIEYRAVGPCIEAGVLTNVFGDTNFIIRTRVFRDLGGFREDRGSSFEDWEFLAHLVLSGRDLDAIPQPLFFYRHLPCSFSRRESGHASHLRALRPILEPLPFWLQRALKGWFGSEGPFKVDWQSKIATLEFEVSQLSGQLARAEKQRDRDRRKLEAAHQKIEKLKAKLQQSRPRRPSFAQRLRRLFFLEG